MSATPRSLAELRADAPIEAVELHGRVTLVDDGSARLRIELDGVAVDVALMAAPASGVRALLGTAPALRGGAFSGTAPALRGGAFSGTAPALRGGASLFGSFVRVRGSWNGRQVQAATLDVLHSPTRDLARADSDFAWGRAGALATLARRHQILRSIRGFFDHAGFIETETPAVVRSPGLELHLDALEVLGARGPHWLQTSPEYHMKRLLSAGMSRIYQLCKCYRRNEHGALHQPEFTMLEWYRAFAGSEEMMRDTEQLVAQLANGVHGSLRIPGLSAEVDVTPPWERLSVRDAFARYASVRMDDVVHDEDAFYRVLVEQIEPQLGRGRPVFLTRYPASMAALARLCADDASVADRFEAYVDGVELCNGFGELTDAAEQRRRLELDRSRRKQLERAVYPLDERFLDALEDGMPPSGGNALGVDRLVMLLLGVANIADVVAFAVDRA